METDRMIRRLKLWEKQTCSEKDSQGFLSIPLLTIFLIKEEKEWSLNHSTEIFRRIIYRMPWKLEQNETYPIIELNGKMSSLLNIISVRDFRSHGKDIESRIVMIGSSYKDSDDSYKTPLGEMPGALIIINAINSLFFDEKIPSLHMLQKFGLLTLLIFFMSVFFTLFDSFVRMVVFYIVILLILVPAIFISFRACVLFDFGIPLGILGILDALPLEKLVSIFGKERL